MVLYFFFDNAGNISFSVIHYRLNVLHRGECNVANTCFMWVYILILSGTSQVDFSVFFTLIILFWIWIACKNRLRKKKKNFIVLLILRRSLNFFLSNSCFNMPHFLILILSYLSLLILIVSLLVKFDENALFMRIFVWKYSLITISGPLTFMAISMIS